MFNCPFVDTIGNGILHVTIDCRECEYYWANREKELNNLKALLTNIKIIGTK